MIEFLEQEHIYLVDGTIVPSVTQIIQKIFPDKYKGISQRVLKKKAEFGTEGHKIIEELDITNKQNALERIFRISNKDLQICIREYLRLVQKHDIKPLEYEKIVAYKYLFVGRLDMTAEVGGVKSLLDVKFTASLDEEYLSWQLGMYEMAYGEKFGKHYCLWLPKGKLGKLVEIHVKTEQEIIEKLEELGLA